MNLCQQHLADLESVLVRYGLSVKVGAPNTKIPGSYWGAPEAGLIGSTVHVAPDTPVHSVLHESAHFVCMTSERRMQLHTDAGGNHQEESAVCYLSVLIADWIPGFGRGRMFIDMDDWGYSFRLGKAQVWFETDALDAREWLISHSLIDEASAVTWALRV